MSTHAGDLNNLTVSRRRDSGCDVSGIPHGAARQAVVELFVEHAASRPVFNRVRESGSIRSQRMPCGHAGNRPRTPWLCP